MQDETKQCARCKNFFTLDADDFSFYEKMKVPAPGICPECRFKRRASFRNERTLYKQTCKLCNRSVITMYSPESGVTVYCNDCWASDKWDPKNYAKEYDPDRPFFDQLKELFLATPQSATYSSAGTGTNVNSEYA